MKQFILNNESINGSTVKLSGNDYKYLVKVRRLAIGETFPALLPDETKIIIKVISINNGVLTGEIINSSSALSVSQCLCESNYLILFQALPKGDKMELIARQAAETGIAEIVPFISKFSVAKKNIGEQKFARWEKIIKEARQQSGSKINTIIKKPLSIKELFDYWQSIKEKSTGLLFHHQRGVEQKTLHEYLNNVSIDQNMVLAIGPEGGFSDAEVSLFMENGFAPFTIGNSILRTETAALYCAAAVCVILTEKNSWHLK